MAKPRGYGEGPWVDGPALVKQALETAQLLRPHWPLVVDNSPVGELFLEAPARCMKVRLAGAGAEVVYDHLQALKIPLCDGSIQHLVLKIPETVGIAVLKSESEAVGMACGAKLHGHSICHPACPI
jgi:hypothetical protein